MLAILFITVALICINLLTIVNVFALPRLRKRSRQQKLDTLPFVSVLIPARNEAAVIERTMGTMRSQSYARFEVIFLDDNSTDGTGDIAQEFGETWDRLTVLQGKPLPPGWMGKNWACHQMSDVAQGDILLFFDADVRCEPETLDSLVTHMLSTKADLLTVWPTQETVTWFERLTVPLMAMAIMGYLPVLGTHFLPFTAFGAANGQCMAWKRQAYDRVGGHSAVRDNVLEDVTLARLVKQAGMRLRMADGNHWVTCRMYTDWPSVRDGYAKNILAGYGNSVPLLLLGTVFHWALFLMPWVWLASGGDFEWALALIVMGLLFRALSAAYTRQRVIDAVFLPISVLLMTRIAAQSIYWQVRFGGPRWKGRVIQRTRKVSQNG